MTTDSLNDRVIIVTGGASGIGRATAELCARRGARVVLADLPQSEGAAVADSLTADGHTVRFVACDVSDESDVENLLAATSEFGRLNVLIACAGILQGATIPIEDFETATFDRVLGVNARGMFLCAKHSVRAMSEAGGVILLLASGAGVTSGSSSYAYGTSKGAVHGLGLVMQGRMGYYPIRVNTVAPGSIATALKLQNVIDVGQASGVSDEEIRRRHAALGDPIGVARVLAFLASDEAYYVRGTVFTR
ncbi:MAG: SDR family oxidoreductase [Chloroflexi bacterium]|nr:SDR family oxidoreductase [Chloroflexota bacterium]